MNLARTVAVSLTRLSGLTQLALGLLIWIRAADNLVGIHIPVGLVLILGLWALAGLAAASGVNPILIVVAVLWGVLTPTFGLIQDQILPGESAHWAVRVLHLLAGLIAIGLAEILSSKIRRSALAQRLENIPKQHKAEGDNRKRVGN